MLRKRIPVCILIPCFFQIHFDVILLSLPIFKRFCSLRSSDRNICGTLRMYTILTLPTVLYVWETWFVLLREEHLLGGGVLKKRVLRGIFGTEWEEVSENCRMKAVALSYSPAGSLKAIKLRWARLTAWIGKKSKPQSFFESLWKDTVDNINRSV